MAGPEFTPKTPLGGVSAFSCSNCGGQIKLRAPGQTMRAGCTHCGAIIDLTDENMQVLHQYKRRMRYELTIPLGTRGTFDEKEWEVIGLIVRQAMGYDYYWEEYLLFNPFYGFRWLLNQYGHWSLTEMLTDVPDARSGSRNATWRGKNYKGFGKGRAEVVFVYGEFYYEVSRGDQVQTFDLVRPGEMLSMEADKSEKNWSHSIYLKPKEVQNAFKEELSLPKQKGIAPHQVNPYRARLNSILYVFIAALLLLVIGQFTLYSNSSNELMTTMTGTSQPNQPEKVSEPFNITGNTSNVEIEFSSSRLSNTWMEAIGYLRNRETNEAFEFNLSAEYYSGVTDGESWSEGDKSPSKVFNLVPSGEYELVAQIYQEKPEMPFSFDVRRDVPISSNFFLVLILLAIPVVGLGVFSYLFHKQQWAESDFSS